MYYLDYNNFGPYFLPIYFKYTELRDLEKKYYDEKFKPLDFI